MNHYNNEIFKAISSTHPFLLEEVKEIYKITKSYDNTLDVLKEAGTLRKNPIELAIFLVGLKLDNTKASFFKTQMLEMPEETFFNKEKSDAIRDCVKTSAANYTNAIRWLSKSKDIGRDSELIKVLSDKGVNSSVISVTISALNKG